MAVAGGPLLLMQGAGLTVSDAREPDDALAVPLCDWLLARCARAPCYFIVLLLLELFACIEVIAKQ